MLYLTYALFEVKHIKGVKNTADYISRRPVLLLVTEKSNLTAAAEKYVNMITQVVRPSAISMNQLVELGLSSTNYVYFIIISYFCIIQIY
jgi:hypothetical protein